MSWLAGLAALGAGAQAGVNKYQDEGDKHMREAREKLQLMAQLRAAGYKPASEGVGQQVNLNLPSLAGLTAVTGGAGVGGPTATMPSTIETTAPAYGSTTPMAMKARDRYQPAGAADGTPLVFDTQENPAADRFRDRDLQRDSNRALLALRSSAAMDRTQANIEGRAETTQARLDTLEKHDREVNGYIDKITGKYVPGTGPLGRKFSQRPPGSGRGGGAADKSMRELRMSLIGVTAQIADTERQMRALEAGAPSPKRDPSGYATYQANKTNLEARADSLRGVSDKLNLQVQQRAPGDVPAVTGKSAVEPSTPWSAVGARVQGRQAPPVPGSAARRTPTVPKSAAPTGGTDDNDAYAAEVNAILHSADPAEVKNRNLQEAGARSGSPPKPKPTAALEPLSSRDVAMAHVDPSFRAHLAELGYTDDDLQALAQ